MQAIIRKSKGGRVEVIVAVVGRFTMRVIARGSRDTVELRSEYGQWVDEAGNPVEFEALLAGEAGVCRVPAAQGASFEVG